MKTQVDTRKIFVGCLRCYNESKIVGEWLDLNDFTDVRELYEKGQEIVKNSPCVGGEEYTIQDHEGFGGLLQGPYPSFSLAWSIHETLLHAEEEGIEADVFLEYISTEGYGDLMESCDHLVEKFQDAFRGCYDSIEDWAYEFVGETLLCELEGKVKEQVEYFFDYKKYASDCKYSGDIWTFNLNGKVYVFASNY